jgi:predicted TIM-barrel fold metal-dependent hydrolase
MTSFTKRTDNYFKIDPECHLIGDMEHLNYFPGVQMWWRAIDNIKRPLFTGAPWEMLATYAEGMEEREALKDASPENILWAMDKYGVDIACLLPESMMDSTGYTTRWVTNGQMAKIVETNPERFMYQPNVSPIKYKGVQNTIKEMTYWVKEKGAKIFKFYPPEDTYMNDPEIWPFYEKAQELGIVLDIHTGFCWVPPGKSKYALPVQLDDVARDFPELKINAFHMGYPYSDDLNMIAMAHPNVYICMSLLVPWAVTAPRKFAKLLGEAMRWVGPDKITWGTDYAGYSAQIRGAVMGLRDFQIPEDLQAQYGYQPITDEDKAKMFGGNLGRLLGIDTSKRRVSISK